MPTQPEYNELAKAADDQTGVFSLTSQMLRQPACQLIIQQGKDVLPFLFQDIKVGMFHCHWRMATISIILETAALPPVEIPEKFRSKVREMERIYTEYGVAHQYI